MIVMAEQQRTEALRRLRIEEADAWFEYQESSAALPHTSSPRYREVEPWAWARLQQRLRSVATRRAKVQR